jgi:nitrate reductase gamma subunit
MDMVTYLLLTVLILLGSWMTFRYTLFTDDPYNYRHSISDWWRSLFYFDPDVEAASSALTVYQLHAIVAWAFWAVFPFSRLVHAWSIPLQYLGRPHILYRRRYGKPERTGRLLGQRSRAR